MEVIDALDAIRAERDEQKRRYMLTLRAALQLGGLNRASEQEELDRIEQAVRDLTKECRKKEAQLEPLRLKDHEEYVLEMVELCDKEAKAFSQLTNDLRELVREVNLRRASTTLSEPKGGS